jgi:hypothetical protein
VASAIERLVLDYCLLILLLLAFALGFAWVWAADVNTELATAYSCKHELAVAIDHKRKEKSGHERDVLMSTR